mmetsp:Transcript_65302/g.142250  ORF Transcript_65302/g.142250 Transcript_65302/m.142250 type:complete len:301 (-) Transcript_65302:538-1440(-)
MDPDRFNRRVGKWCDWEERQWGWMMRTFGEGGLGLPGTAATLIAKCVAGPAAGQASHDEIIDIPHVLQEVEHTEPAPLIDEEVARTAVLLETDERWANIVERRLRHESTASEAGADPWDAAEETRSIEQSEQVFLLRVGGSNIEGLRQRLLTGPELAPCREALQAASDLLDGRSCELPEKALVFVNPWQYDAVRRALVGVELHYFHIISQRFEYLLEEALQIFPHRQRAKVKQQHRQALALDPLQAETTVAPVELGRVIVDRTFLCLAPQRTAPSQVNQSTTEAVADSSSPFHYGHTHAE